MECVGKGASLQFDGKTEHRVCNLAKQDETNPHGLLFCDNLKKHGCCPKDANNTKCGVGY